MHGATESPPCAGSGVTVRLLYVEDDYITAGIVKRNLERRPGFSVDLAEDSRSGLELALSRPYDILLVDNDIPGVGGLEFVRELRARGNSVPAIMITGAGDEATAINALKSGFKDYVVKDVDGSFLHVLPSMVEQVIHQEAAERMLAEKNKENQRLLAELLETNKHLKNLNELKNEVLGIAAHDLRNPISSIVAAINYLIEQEDDPTSRRYTMLDICRESSRQAINLIDELLNPDRLASGDIELRPDHLDLAILARQVLKLNLTNSSRKQITVELSADFGVVGVVDAFRFRELLDNLVSNAIKYSPPGSKVTVRVFRDGDTACVAVADEGPGFTEDDRRHIYKRFCRLSARPTANESSTGLGLSIVKRIADLHEATIDLDTTPGSGSVFTVRFPVA